MNAVCRRGSAALVALVASCGGDAVVPSGPGGVANTFTVTNQLLAPVTIDIDGSVAAILVNGRSTALTAPAGARMLTWTSAKPADSHGVQIPDDIGEVKMPVADIVSALEITNVIRDVTYVTVSLFNTTAAQVSIGVWDGAAVSCASVLPAKSGLVNGFTQTGYYHLSPATELRAYRDGSNCTGPYVAWPRAELAAFAPKSGLVRLTLTAAP